MLDLLELVNQDDPLQVVLRGHLVLEATLIELIEAALPNPKEIDLEQVPFACRVDLAIAMDVLPRDMRARFMKINSIRNRFAHNLDSEISSEDIKVLWDGLIKSDRQALLKTSFERKDVVGKFGGFVLITYYRLKQIHSYL